MKATNYRELRCWQLANELREEVLAICEITAAARDSRFCDGFRNAVGSVCRNLAEGFARYHSSDIVKFFRYALASLEEVSDYLEECRLRHVIDAAQYERVRDKAQHARATTLNFMRPHEQRCRARDRRSRHRPD